MYDIIVLLVPFWNLKRTRVRRLAHLAKEIEARKHLPLPLS